MAHVGLGKSIFNKFKKKGTAAHIHANFDRKEGGQNVDSTKPDKRKPRIIRPGAIILPNLDIDEDSAVVRSRFKFDEVDARHNDKVDKGDDKDDVTLFKLGEPAKHKGNANRLTIEVQAADAKRIRIWEVPKGETIYDGIEIIGPTKGHSYKLLDQDFIFLGEQIDQLPDTGWELEYYVEALTLPGDTTEPAATTKAPEPPGVHRTPAPDTAGGSQESPTVNATDQTKSIYDTEKRLWDLPTKPAARAPGDIWVKIIHATDAGVAPKLSDVALFTIAPWIMTWNTLPCKRVYVAYFETTPGPDIFPGSAFDNHSMVWDLQHACAAAGLKNNAPKEPNTDSTVEIETNKPTELENPDDVPFYVIKNPAGDRWVQDEFEIGYCFAPHQWLNVAVNLMRSSPGTGLSKFVEEEIAHPKLAIFNGINKSGNSLNFGGNLEVSPPVDAPSDPQGISAAGPKIKAHRKAPFGKIILGDFTPRPCEKDFRKFLSAQLVQPILPVDTSWLAVAHVDEFMSFVKAKDGKKFRMLFASVRCMWRLLISTFGVDSAATMHMGKYKYPEFGPITNDKIRKLYDEFFVRDWLLDTRKKGVRKYSNKVDAQKLSLIRKRIRLGLKLDKKDILSIPTYFEVPHNPGLPFGNSANRTVARNVGMVNMLVVNKYLMVPQPHGPRMSLTDATKVVTKALKKWFAKEPPIPSASMTSPDEHFFWARPGETVEELALYFARSPSKKSSERINFRKDLIKKIKDPTHSLKASNQIIVTALKNKILADPVNTGATTSITTIAPSPTHIFSKWMRVKIPDDTVDVFECYMKSILEPLGNNVHFIENFESYHALSGEVHCGTNVKRDPPELDAAFKSRWWDKGVYDPDYDTSYDPSIPP